MRIVYFGSPDFAVPSLKALYVAGHDIVAVVTQPDRAKGRGGNIAMTAVKKEALALNIPVIQPEKVNDPQVVCEIMEYGADIFVVVAFGQILREALLTATKYGAVNLHASLLPAYRGAAPIHWAVVNGEERTGITTMFMDRGMDTGNIIHMEGLEISPGDDTGTLHEKMSLLGAGLLCRTVADIEAGIAPSIPQNNALASYAPLIKKEDEVINWRMTAWQIHNHIRGMSPWPVAHTVIEGRRLKVWRSVADSELEIFDTEKLTAGQVAAVIDGRGILVKTGKDCLLLTEVQPEGRQRMPADAFARGYKITTGTKFGGEI